MKGEQEVSTYTVCGGGETNLANGPTSPVGTGTAGRRHLRNREVGLLKGWKEKRAQDHTKSAVVLTKVKSVSTLDLILILNLACGKCFLRCHINASANINRTSEFDL